MRKILIALAILVVVASAGVVANGARLKRFAYEGFGGRDDWQQPETVVASLGVRAGDRVADIGAGGGYFTFRLADAVGGEGTVYAVDVDEEMTDFLDDRVAREGRANVEVILGQYDDPLLPDGGVDLVFLSNTYHHVEDPASYFSRLRADLSPRGRVAIVEYKEGSWWMPGKHWMERKVIERDMRAAGYRLETNHDVLPRQHFLVFGIAEE